LNNPLPAPLFSDGLPLPGTKSGRGLIRLGSCSSTVRYESARIAESGALAALIGAVPTVVIGGAASILLAVVWARLFPALRDRDRLIPEPSGRTDSS
jgi:hypothetical protein